MTASHALALAPTFAKGVTVIVAAMVLFVGSVYLLLSAVFGLRMGYLVLAVSFFGWMIIFSLIWVFGAPGSTPKNQGPRGTEPHWQVFAAGTGTVSSSKYDITTAYPNKPWHPPDAVTQASVNGVTSVIQDYLVAQFVQEANRHGQHLTFDEKTNQAKQGDNVIVNATDFIVQDVEFATVDNKNHLGGVHAFFNAGGPEITVFAYHDHGNVQIYSVAFLAASILGFMIHLPLLDKAEARRKEILTGGTAPPWYGPA
jgi:hypothetical protein